MAVEIRVSCDYMFYIAGASSGSPLRWRIIPAHEDLTGAVFIRRRDGRELGTAFCKAGALPRTVVFSNVPGSVGGGAGGEVDRLNATDFNLGDTLIFQNETITLGGFLKIITTHHL